MKRAWMGWMGLAAAAALVSGGCVARAPERGPAPGMQAGMVPGDTAGSTTGDADACAEALGNAVLGDTVGYTGGADSPNATAGAPGGPAAGPTGPVGITASPDGTVGSPGGGVTEGFRHEVTANGVMIGNVALVALPSADALPMHPAGGTAAGTPLSAIDRIQLACPKVAQIRVVIDPGHREQLAEIALAIRKGEPITDFLADLTAISDHATVAAEAQP